MHQTTNNQKNNNSDPHPVSDEKHKQTADQKTIISMAPSDKCRSSASEKNNEIKDVEIIKSNDKINCYSNEFDGEDGNDRHLRIAEAMENRCGWFNFRPAWLQRYMSPKWALFWLCWAGAVQGTYIF